MLISVFHWEILGERQVLVVSAHSNNCLPANSRGLITCKALYYLMVVMVTDDSVVYITGIFCYLITQKEENDDFSHQMSKQSLLISNCDYSSLSCKLLKVLHTQERELQKYIF